MAKQKFERNKPHVNIGTTGHVDHGKTTLTAAIIALPRDRGLRHPEAQRRRHRQRARGKRARHYDRHLAPRVRDDEAPLRARRLPRSRRLHQEHDHRRGADGRRDPRRVGDRRPDAADARAHSAHAQVGVPYIVVFLNKVDMVDDEELLELVEMEVRELLSPVRVPRRRHADHPRLGAQGAQS